MNRIHHVRIIEFSTICRHFIDILRPGIGSHYNNRIRVIGTYRLYHIYRIRTELVPRCSRRFIADLVDDITLVFVHFRIHIKKFDCLAFGIIRIFRMNVPVNDGIHSKICQIRNAFLNVLVQFVLGSLGVTALRHITDKAHHINAPFIAQILKCGLI